MAESETKETEASVESYLLSLNIDLSVLEKILAGSVAERKRNHNC